MRTDTEFDSMHGAALLQSLKTDYHCPICAEVIYETAEPGVFWCEECRERFTIEIGDARLVGKEKV